MISPSPLDATAASTATIFDVQRFSVHDGPGIRTVVFFKGCALACEWCQNPEAIRAAPELSYDEARCLEQCTRCTSLCPENAIHGCRGDRVDFSRCTACGQCVTECPSEALRLIGRTWTTEDLSEALLRDRPFYESSGGGITLSGGEPVLHSRFLERLLPLVKREGVHVTLETCGAYPFALLEPLLPAIDLILFDFKVADAGRHRALTGRTNEQILANLACLLASDMPIDVRMPVVPGRNDDASNISASAARLAELGVSSLTLLPYNPLWEAKLARLGGGRRPLGIPSPRDGFYADMVDAFARRGISASI